MAEYIDREALLKKLPNDLPYKASVKRVLIQSSVADVAEVVRCKDCKFNVSNMQKDLLDITDYSGDDIVCSYFMTDGMSPDDYCSYGKRGD